MTIFPTQYSLLSSVALKAYLQEAYGLSGMTCNLLIHNVSDTYILQNQSEKYIFKLYRDGHRNTNEIKAEIELLNLLKDKGAKVSYPIKDLKGKEVQSFYAAEGIRNGVLFNFAPGKPTHDLNDDRLKIIGREMAFIHNITSNVELSYPRKVYDIQTTLIEPLDSIKPAFAELPDEYAYLQRTTEKVIEKMNQFDTTKFSYGYCHYDFLPKNFHFDENNGITFFDFDFFGKGFLANDLMTFFVHFFFEVLFNKLTREEADQKFNTFLIEYKRTRHLSDEEINAFPYLGYAFWLFFLQYYHLHFENGSNTFFGPGFKKERMAWIKKWVDMYCKF